MPTFISNRLIRSALLGCSLLIASEIQPLGRCEAQQGTTEVGAPRVDGIGIAQDSQVIINQVDTSEFPKVRLFATVLKSGTPQIGLSASDFRVREDEVDQEPLTVVPKLTPLSLVVALDTSGSMHKAIEKAKLAATGFVERLSAEDEVATIGFARQVTLLSAFSPNKDLAKAAIAATAARGDTALYDALYKSVEVLKTKPGRKAIVLLSDGRDDDGTGKQLSKHSIDEVLGLAKEVNVPVFIIGLGSEIDRETLAKVATATGAIVQEAPTAEQLQSIYDGIGKQLSGQYGISYTSNLPADGSSHRIQLTQGGSTGMKEYVVVGTMPRPVPVVPVAVSKPVTNTAAAAPSGLERSEFGYLVAGGLSFDAAQQLQPGVTYHFNETSKTVEFSRYFALPTRAGFAYYAYWQNTDDGYATVAVFTALRKELGKKYTSSSPWSSQSFTWEARKENEGVAYLNLQSKVPVIFGILEVDRTDAGSGTDAGEEEDTALTIMLNQSAKGFVSENFDTTDRYRVDVPEGASVVIKARPSGGLTLKLSASDGEGKKLREVYSPNEGALAKLEAESVGGGVLFVDVTAYGGGDRGSYNLVVGDANTPTPSSPKVPEQPIFPTKEAPGK